MPVVDVNGCKLYYEEYGVDQPDKFPVLLIHGSTQTGQSCWGLVAPLLARKFRVIVPDCRGHGQSTNPGMSYRFKEIARDCAELVRVLGYTKAHIIGHSNGGNIALVTLMEHPEIVQSAVLQAANAYVSADLIEKEPHIFDPGRVEREAPEWMEEMIRLHAATHGDDYWRKLLQLTVAEIISEPNYSAEELARVDRPVLVIQGEDDRVNAPSRHAQFIAKHIPCAQLWVPQGVGHNVHEEITCAWIERVISFLKERGDPYNDAIYRFKRDHHLDDRISVFQVHADQEAHKLEGKLTLTGRVLSPEQSEEIETLLSLPGVEIDNQIQILTNESTAWGVLQRPVADLRKMPSNRAERVSQALLGEVVQILEQGPEWSWVRMDEDGYLGWLHSNALQVVSQAQVRDYQKASNACVHAELLDAVRADSNFESQRWGKLPFGVLLHVVEWLEHEAVIQLPGGSMSRVARAGLTPMDHLPEADLQGKLFTLGLVERFIGIPYLWGGRSPFGFDCSGLAQMYFKFMKVNLPRDADQQYLVGQLVIGEPQPGDLLFFGEADANDHGRDRVAHISHVAISLGGDKIIHANGTAWGVSINSLTPGGPGYQAWLKDHLVGIRRYP